MVSTRRLKGDSRRKLGLYETEAPVAVVDARSTLALPRSRRGAVGAPLDAAGIAPIRDESRAREGPTRPSRRHPCTRPGAARPKRTMRHACGPTSNSRLPRCNTCGQRGHSVPRVSSGVQTTRRCCNWDRGSTATAQHDTRRHLREAPVRSGRRRPSAQTRKPIAARMRDGLDVHAHRPPPREGSRRAREGRGGERLRRRAGRERAPPCPGGRADRRGALGGRCRARRPRPSRCAASAGGRCARRRCRSSPCAP